MRSGLRSSHSDSLFIVLDTEPYYMSNRDFNSLVRKNAQHEARNNEFYSEDTAAEREALREVR